jgi:hypothetical protein
MFIGEKIEGLSNAEATLGPESERPAVHPGTCILTLENDMWFSFVTDSAYKRYEVVIVHGGCNTPAGLQALVIHTNGCDAKQFEYKGCSNKQTEDTIRIFFEEPQAGLNYLIYVDGFDGTICQYSLELKGRKDANLSADQYRNLQNNYDPTNLPEFDPDNFNFGFVNNTVEMEWTANSGDEIAYFMVEEYPVWGSSRTVSKYTRVLAVVEPVNKVAGGEAHYRFVDSRPAFSDREYQYRVVCVMNDGSRKFSPQFSVKAKPFYELFVGEVKKSPEPGKYMILYINKKNKATYSCDVLDENMNLLKSYTLHKEPVRDGTVTFDMAPFPAGRYFFRMGDGERFFLREFFSEGKPE